MRKNIAVELTEGDVELLDYIRAKFSGSAPKDELVNYYDCHDDIAGALEMLTACGVLEKAYGLKVEGAFMSGEELYAITEFGIALHDYYTLEGEKVQQ